MSRHTPFDGGLELPYRTIVRNAVVELLSPLLRANDGFLAAVVKLPDRIQRMDENGSMQLFQQLLGRAPAIGVAIGDRVAQPAGISGNRQLTFLDVHVFFINNHARSLMARVEADVTSTGDGELLLATASADPGIDVAMQCAEELLIGRQLERPAPQPPEAPDLGTGKGVIRHLELRREESLITDNQATVWEQTYVVGVSRSINKTRGVLARLLGIDTNIHPPGEPESPARIEFAHDFEEAPPP